MQGGRRRGARTDSAAHQPVPIPFPSGLAAGNWPRTLTDWLAMQSARGGVAPTQELEPARCCAPLKVPSAACRTHRPVPKHGTCSAAAGSAPRHELQVIAGTKHPRVMHSDAAGGTLPQPSPARRARGDAARARRTPPH